MTGLGDVKAGYRHIAKTVTPRSPLTAGGAVLKWYDLAADSVPDAIRADAERYLRHALSPVLDIRETDAGFVILHRCGGDFYFLLPAVWRGSNELWQGVHYRDRTMEGFAAFDPAYPPPGVVRPTFCVWELGVVAHEAEAWARYLRSSKTDADRAVWHADGRTGTV